MGHQLIADHARLATAVLQGALNLGGLHAAIGGGGGGGGGGGAASRRGRGSSEPGQSPGRPLGLGPGLRGGRGRGGRHAQPQRGGPEGEGQGEQGEQGSGEGQRRRTRLGALVVGRFRVAEEAGGPEQCFGTWGCICFVWGRGLHMYAVRLFMGSHETSMCVCAC